MSRRQSNISAVPKRATSAVTRSPKSEPQNEDYHRLLAHFNNTDRQAEREFLEFRQRVIVFFDRRQCQDPDLLADEAFTRAARAKELDNVKDIRGFIYKIARLMALEHGRIQRRQPEQVGDMERLATTELVAGTQGDSEDRKTHEVRLQCLDWCLSKLSRADQKLLLDYYREETGEKVKRRKSLAAALGFKIGTLRTRLCRARAEIAVCCHDCIQNSLEQMKQF